jgi:hypothetical protein
VGVLLCVPARGASSRFVSLIHLSSEKRTPRSRLTPPLFSPSAPAFQLTRYYRYGELDTCEGRWAAIWACMDRSKRYVPGSIEGGNISTTESLFERARATLTPLSFSRHRRDGQGLSTKAPVHVPGAPERGKPYWTLMDPKEAGRLWRKQYGDKVPAPAEESKPSGT